MALAVPRATLQERRPHIREAEGEPRSSVRSSFAARSLKKKLKNNRVPLSVVREPFTRKSNHGSFILRL